MFDASNHNFRTALNFVNQTGRHIFLTGKAGTGKTTFLKYIKENTFKKMTVVAPTGVAAINAGGVTMHSFFQLPFGPYIPGSHNSNGLYSNITDQHTLFKNIRFNADKRTLLQELELLVIDEVSMVRADMLDAIDTILRHFRQQPLTPFGGVQVLYIGDLFQLPPVANNQEWEYLQHYYKSPFFFDAHVLQQAPPIYVELTKIYRQNEASFIHILNNIRNNRATQDDLEDLHRFYHPGFQPPKEENYITLTSHNAKADTINQSELNKLTGRSRIFEALVTGDFNDRSFPAEKALQLKEGAQIMFIKNDKGEFRRYFNGRIGIIKSIEEEKITVIFSNTFEELTVEKETWRNIRYTYNKETDTIEEEELGTFTQYPIRLAWAITIHKSQGLTFEKAIIDAGASFAAGQVYVALSRLTSMDGLILYSRIQPHSISTDERVVAFTETALPEEALQENLKQEQKIFISHSLVNAFNWSRLVDELRTNDEESSERMIPEKHNAITFARKMLDNAIQQKELADKFIRQLEQLLPVAEENGYVHLQQRVSSAANYFIKCLEEELISPLQKHIKEMIVKQKTKKYVQLMEVLKLKFLRKKQYIEHALQVAEGLVKGMDASELLSLTAAPRKNMPENVEGEDVVIISSSRPKKGDSRLMTLSLFKEGKKIAGIAAQRGLAASTIAQHLASFIASGEIDIKELVHENKIAAILAVIRESGEIAQTPLKEKLGADYSYGEIRAVINYHLAFGDANP